ncbi:hypothetical protein HOLleu_44240 [Holothuria leucospilota]|uniref:Uncharacterized protein n=1 Tax=Holothuria leucospilota TaxID=206669 RepID=A0A9Q0YAM7_HOLLE|nr:hypothetical protein HOLleu_44240 [Holothuria leucospilota]
MKYATRNNVKVPENWSVKKKAGEAFWLRIKKTSVTCYPCPRSNIPGSVQTAFNRHTVGRFYANLAEVMDRYKFEARDIYNVDETGCTTVQKAN